MNCDCMLSDDPDGNPQGQQSKIIVPEENEFQDESAPGINETNGVGQNRCNECGSRLEWELRLDGVTVRTCPNC